MKTVKPKKFLGQHFLKDLKIAQDIADTVDACPRIPVLEVGPGMGVMTQFLVRKDRPLKVVEIDFESVAYLRTHYPQLEENIIEDDFLKMHLERTFGGPDAALIRRSSCPSGKFRPGVGNLCRMCYHGGAAGDASAAVQSNAPPARCLCEQEEAP